MAAAEVDNFPYSKYTAEQRREKKNAFFRSYLEVCNTTSAPHQSCQVLLIVLSI